MTYKPTYRMLLLTPTELYVSVNSRVEDGNGWGTDWCQEN